MVPSVLDVHDLTKRFGSFTAVDSISFSLQQGEVLGLLGPNGAGKTTTIQMLLNLMHPTSGEIHYFGNSFALFRTQTLKRLNYTLGYSKLPGRLTVMENLIVYGWLYEVDDIKGRIYQLAELFEAGQLLSKKTDDLSAGELTRVFLIKTFINQPEIILLDEPTASLDPDISAKIRGYILAEKNRRKMSILITSHNMTEIEEMCDRVIFLHQGKIVDEGTPQQLARKRKESELHLMVESGHEALRKLVDECGFRFSEKKNFTVIHLPEAQIAACLSQIGKRGISYSQIEIVHPSLVDFFIETAARR